MNNNFPLDGDHITIISVIFVACLALVSIVAVVQNKNVHGYEAVRQLIEKGTDPIAAGCAIWGETNSLACALTSAKQK